MKIYFKDVRDFSVLRNAIRDLNNKIPFPKITIYSLKIPLSFHITKASSVLPKTNELLLLREPVNNLLAKLIYLINNNLT